jgi:hypothetical protein
MISASSKVNPPHSGLDRLCYKNGSFVCSGYYLIAAFEWLTDGAIRLSAAQLDLSLEGMDLVAGSAKASNCANY